MRVKVKDTKICESCKYWSDYSLGCNYIVEKKQSRNRDEFGNKTDPNYCDKYIEGKKKAGEVWLDLKMGIYNEKGGRKNDRII